MSRSDHPRHEFRDLVDMYCSGTLDEEGQRKLESDLLADPDARHEFVAYFQMHTELVFAIRAKQATAAALEHVAGAECMDQDNGGALDAIRGRSRATGRLWFRRWRAIAAGLLIAALGYTGGHLTLRSGRPWRGAADRAGARSDTKINVAWLVNAQDCQWASAQSEMPGRDMSAGKILRLERGLAEIEFDQGARLILQGPAELELLSGNGARLLAGSLTARVPARARGFTVFSPQGKIVDLGTSFGLSVEKQGATAVRVFEGTVEAYPIGGAAAAPTNGLTLHEAQSALIDRRSVAIKPDTNPTRYIREIVPPPIVTPRTRALDFARTLPGTLLDARGFGVGLTHRLPGTGSDLVVRDANLRLNTRRGALELTTTRSDINTQQGMGIGEYLGFRLADLGFGGSEDFAVSATIPEIPELESVGQFGLYAGSRSDRNIRGGLISQPQPDRYLAFLVNNNGGRDSDLHEVGLVKTGDDLRLTLQRVHGAYSLVVENLTRSSSSTLSIAHPSFLDGERDLFVGFFGANTRSDRSRTLTIKSFSAKVWTVSRREERKR